jgi:2-polyprenyl-3-methyl-5-hydroxy-6-metoxy-1,4-benzoquinol methylase
MKKYLHKIVHKLGYELKRIPSKQIKVPQELFGPFISHYSLVDTFQYAANCSSAMKIRNDFLNKLTSAHYHIVNFPCPICRSEHFTEVAHSEEGFKWGICTSCGLLQLHQRLNNPSLNAFYESGEYQIICMGNLADDLHYKIEYEVNSLCVIDVLEKLQLPIRNKRFLEIGCGSGGILRALQDKGAVVHGYDLDAHRINVGKKHVQELYAADAMDPSCKLPDNLDYILVSNVLEHLSDPLQFLKDLRSKIEENAITLDKARVMIDVPNLESAVYHSQDNFLKFLHIAHLWYFNSITIERLLNQAGFTIESLMSRNSSFTVVAKPSANPIPNTNNAYWNSISSINLANFIYDPQNLQSRVKVLLEKIF